MKPYVPFLLALSSAPALAQAPRFEGPSALVPSDCSLLYSIAIGDFDGDGNAADVAATSQSVELWLFRDLGDGTWGPAIHAAQMSWGTFDLEAADLDGDGDLDLVATHSSQFALSLGVLRNDGNGGFGSQSPYFFNHQISDVALADYDLDGDVDIAVTRFASSGTGTGGFLFLPNQGDGTFGAATAYPTSSIPYDIVAADVDLDGDADVVLTEPVAQRVRVYYNAGNGTFPTQAVFFAGIAATKLSTFDIDADGDLDLAGVGDADVCVLSNSGTGAFALSSTSIEPGFSYGICGFDADGDGPDDVAVALENKFAVRIGTAGALGPPVAYSSGRYALAPVDFDRDGDVDLIQAAQPGFAFRNSGDGRFFPSPTTPSTAALNKLRLGDLDGDGDLDAVIGDNPTVGVQWNAGDGTFSAPTTIATGGRVWALELVDVDADGDLDVASGHTTGGFVVTLNLGGGTFAAPVAYPAGNTNGIAFGDHDGDGDLDAVVTQGATSTQPTGTMWRFDNLGNGTFAAGVVLSTAANLLGVESGDLNGDGLLDLAVVLYSPGASSPATLHVMLATAPGTFAPPVLYSSNDSGWSLRLADLDGDGDLDVGLRGDEGWHSFRNDGTGVFALVQSLTEFLSWPRELGHVLRDLDADGDVDALVAIVGALGWAYNRGDGTFDPASFVASPLQPHAFDVGDVDGDGDLDAVQGRGGILIVLRGIETAGEPVCAGDGGGTACPCGNASPANAGTGCLHSFGLGGKLRASGSALLSDDTLRLAATDLPASAAALYFQGTALVGGGSGAVFGDGLRCVAGSVLRLGTKASVGGASAYPQAGDDAVSVQGSIAVAGTRWYQVWYRNAASFCTPSTFNLTNALRVSWGA